MNGYESIWDATIDRLDCSHLTFVDDQIFDLRSARQELKSVLDKTSRARQRLNTIQNSIQKWERSKEEYEKLIGPLEDKVESLREIVKELQLQANDLGYVIKKQITAEADVAKKERQLEGLEMLICDAKEGVEFMEARKKWMASKLEEMKETPALISKWESEIKEIRRQYDNHQSLKTTIQQEEFSFQKRHEQLVYDYARAKKLYDHWVPFMKNAVEKEQQHAAKLKK